MPLKSDEAYASCSRSGQFQNRVSGNLRASPQGNPVAFLDRPTDTKLDRLLHSFSRQRRQSLGANANAAVPELAGLRLLTIAVAGAFLRGSRCTWIVSKLIDA